MLRAILALPLLVILMGVASVAMYWPAVYAVAAGDWSAARAFGYTATISLTFTGMVGLATGDFRSVRPVRGHLLSLLAAYTALPVLLAVPFYESVGNTRFLNAYFEMVSSFTTTGATVFDDPARLSGAEHLWRALVGWMGGFLIWVSAIAIMAPLNLGGFMVLGPAGGDSKGHGMSQIATMADPAVRLRRYAARLLPIYTSLTLVLWVGLLILGDAPLVALCHAMSVLATSGISPVGGLDGAASGIGGETLIFVFFFFALSRQTFARDTPDRGRLRLIRDPEMQTGLFIVVSVPLLLFLRHWLGAIEADAAMTLGAGLRALWGGMFTVLSFLTTTGFESTSWQDAQGWSGLETPGLIFLGLTLFGGGVATTAGGLKLLCIYALYKHGKHELEKLVHPSSVGWTGGRARYMRRQGAYVAWIFFMLFAMSIAAVMLALSMTGLEFEAAVVLTISALSTTGPLAGVAGDIAYSYADLSVAAKLILATSMVLGRLEILAIVALLNPEFWRS